jgi:hypothetical protein
VEHTVSPLAAWETFYVIVGSSAAALTGLQFVVTVLAAEMNALGGAPTVRAFGTPTIVHFCAVLLLSAILSAPWERLSSAALVLGTCGIAGIIYMWIVIRQARKQTYYKPVLEDWIWHAALPLAAYMTLLAAAATLPIEVLASLFVIGAVVVVLLFVGIHNAWDAVTYIALQGGRERPEGKS